MKIKGFLKTIAINTLFFLCFMNFLIGDIGDNEELFQPIPELSVGYTGSLSTGVGIELPAGVGDATPALSVNYSPGIDGLLGENWDLSGLPAITRNPSYKINYDNDDHFISGLSGEMVKGANGKYFSNPEAFVVYEFSGDSWKAVDKQGNTWTFSTKLKKKLSEPDSETKAWLLSSFKDRNENSYSITYNENMAQETGLRFPTSITYSNRTIDFEYSSYGNDSHEITTYPAGSKEVSKYILSKITVKAGGTEVKTYKFGYKASGDTYKKPLLNSISKSEGTGATYHNISFDYKISGGLNFQTESGTRLNSTYATMKMPLEDKTNCILGEQQCYNYSITKCSQIVEPTTRASCDKKKAAFHRSCEEYKITDYKPCMTGMDIPFFTILPGDINGDGKPELFKFTGSEREGNINIQQLKIENGKYQEVAEGNREISAGSYFTFQSMGIGDINGDGKTDLAYANGGKLQVAFSNGNGFSSVIAMTNVDIAFPSVNYRFDAPDTRWKGSLIDINNDGLSDYVKPEGDNKIVIYLSNGNSFENGKAINVEEIYRAKDVIQFMDLNGDDILEIYFIEPNGISFWELNGDFTTVGAKQRMVLPNAETSGDVGNRWLVDLNSDGLPDFVVLKKVGENTETHVYLNTGSGFTLVSNEVLPGVVYEDIAGVNTDPPKAKVFSDMNGDGFLDLLAFSGDKIIIYTFNGSKFEHYSEKAADSLFMAFDTNGDGYPEPISLKGDSFAYFVNNPIVQNAGILSGIRGGLWWAIPFLASSTLPPNGGDITIHHTDMREPGNLLDTISDNAGTIKKISYELLSKHAGAVIPGNGSNQKLPIVFPYYVVKGVSITYKNALGGSDIVETENYSYSNGLYLSGPVDKRANLGFETVTVVNNPGNIKTETTFIQTTKEYAGHPTMQNVFNRDGGTVSNETYTYTEKSPFGNPLVLPFTVDTTKYASGKKLYTSSQKFDYDNHGNPSKTTVVTGNFTEVTDVTYSDSTDTSSGIDGWHVGRPITIKQKNNTVVVKDEIYSYDTKGNPNKIVSFPGKNYSRTVSMVYNSNGTVQSIASPSGTLSYTYDSDVGIFPVEETNALSHTIKREYDTVKGLETKITGYNSETVSKTYDGFGRLVSVTKNSDSTPIEKYNYKISKSNGNVTGFLVTKTVNDGSNDITTRTYKDSFGRTIATETPFSENQVLTQQTEYDSEGRKVKESNSYIKGVETPLYSTYTYDIDNRVTKIVHPDNKVTSISYSGFTTTSEVKNSSSAVIATEVVVSNEKGQVLSKTVQGQAIQYTYDAAGRLLEVTDPANGKTVTVYDGGGRILSKTDPDSGKTSFTYDENHRIKTKTDARGVILTYNYDSIGRVTSVVPGNGDPEVKYTYDTAFHTGNHTTGKLTKVENGTETVVFDYDADGNPVYKKHVLSDVSVIFQSEYDKLSRVKDVVYPEGTKVHYLYNAIGNLSSIKMDTADGTSTGHEVVNYGGPSIQDGKLTVTRSTGNGILTEINYDSLHRRPELITTKLPSGSAEQKHGYSYDDLGNISKIEDYVVTARTQSFEYDNLSRLVKATGKYGTEEYAYSTGGNMTKRGIFTLKYENASHIHAVSSAYSENTRTVAYRYDASGNMIGRGSDVLSYNAFGQLKNYTDSGGSGIDYLYDAAGMRRKKIVNNNGEVVYSFYGIYDIHRVPGQGDKHILYLKGIGGELVSQYTRSDAVLLTDAMNPLYPTSTYIKNRVGGFYNKYVTNGIIRLAILSNHHPYLRVYRDSIIWITFLLFMVLLSLYYLRETDLFVRITSPVVFTSLLFGFMIGCNQAVSSKGKGIPPWLISLPSASQEVASVGSSGGSTSSGDTSGTTADDTTTTPSTPTGPMAPSGNPSGTTTPGTTTPTTPVIVNPVNGNQVFTNQVVGMVFVHSDHLGSVTMLTDGYGAVLTGGSSPEKSHISYKPYGEIHRTDSAGPDVIKYKYTGQEEDRETGLYYYKARYYDATLGRFISADTMDFKDKPMGMNRYMYVDGNPIMYTDPTGNSSCAPWIYGAWTGPGECSSISSPYVSFGEDELLILMFLMATSNENDRNLIFAVILWEQYRRLNSHRTEVDRASAIHDKKSEGSRWTTEGAMKGNERWMKSTWSNFKLTPLGIMPTRRMWSRTYKREMGKIPEWMGDLRGPIAELMTFQRVNIELLVTTIGTALFSTANLVNGTIKGVREVGKSIKVDSNLKIDIDFNAKNGNFNLPKVKLQMKFNIKTKGRGKNLFNPKKWRF